MNYKLGSLFDGSGGFPLAGALCDIEPVWAAEVEPYPIAVTRSRFPRMKHLGDISKINGATIEPVDIITFGSPCQDLSVAGKRAGLKHEANGDDETTRSGLFMEAVRIIKEMRTATNGKYPTFALWENVPGAFSSNKGEDFKVVLEEIIKISEPSAVMPEVPQKGWAYADTYIGDGWSLAYRVLDAQYWGVPQRRRRIYLIADFRGGRAKDILFEREGLRGYFTQGRTPWKATPADAQGSSRADDREGEGFDGYNGDLTGDKSATLGVNCGVSTGRNGVIERGSNDTPYTLKIRSGCEGGGKGALVQKDKSATLATNNDQYLFQPITDSHILDDQGGSVINIRTDGKSPTIRAQMGGHPPVVMVPEVTGVDCYNQTLTGDKAKTISAIASDADHVPCAIYSVENHPADSRVNLDESGKVQTLTSRMGTGGGNVPMVMEPVVCLQGNGIDRADTAGCNGKGYREGKSYTLNTVDRPAVAYGLDRAAFNQGQNAKFDFTVTKESQPTLTARGPGAVAQPVYNASKASFFMRATENGAADTLVATDYKDPQLVAYGIDPGASRDVGDLFIEEQSKTITNGSCPGHHNGVVIADKIGSLCASDHKGIRNQDIGEGKAIVEEKPHGSHQYIVCKLTPTECARLQGFADRWGDVDTKTFLTDVEYPFWLEVRKTYDAINGREPKDYTRKQMLTWYNKLHADSAEYKMWGNGIALPTALYVLQGVADALSWAEYEG